ncbi:MAG: OmpA family protein [Rhodobacteraceae bacterium]|nr:OmpA family protein [Paracoccaceae bacterium]
MADGSSENAPIIKKIKKVSGGGHHGGAWKVAYADFVTAMMAFFLLMWLLNATSEEQKKGIADYFSPQIPISERSGGGDSMFNGNTIFTSKDLAKSNIGGKKKTDETDTEDQDADEMAAAAKNAEAGLEGEDAEKTGQQSVQAAIEDALNAIKQAGDDSDLLNHLSLKITPEGLMIEIAERDGAPLFNAGSARPSEKMRQLVAVIAPIVSELANNIAIAGHTDATPFADNARYDNWELSSDRANAARRLMLDEGFPGERVRKVTGFAERDPLTPDDPLAPQNRRIAITLLKSQAAPSQAGPSPADPPQVEPTKVTPASSEE